MRTRLKFSLPAIAFLLFAAPAMADEKSGASYARGLVEFNAGHFETALPLFERAAAAAPDDAYAHYYLGVDRARLGDKAGAEAALREAIARRPGFGDAELELGVLLIDQERWAEAVPPLEDARDKSARSAEASFYLGLAELRLGRLEEARASFARASADPSLATSTRYYLGVVAFQQGRRDQAADAFREVARSNPSSEMGREAAKFLEVIEAGVPFYHVYGGIGLEYDSNVALEPSGEALKGSLPHKDDGRFTISAGGTIAPVRRDLVQLSVGYEFFQSLHFDLTEFNLQDHRPNLQLSFHTGPVRFGIDARYDFYLRKTDAFLHEVSESPWVSVAEGWFGTTVVFYRERLRDFLQSEFDVRDATNHSPGIRQLVYLGAPERWVTLGYRFDNEDPNRSLIDDQAFAYDGHEVSVSFGWLWPRVVDGELFYAYRRELYDDASGLVFSHSTPLQARRDNEHQIALAVSRSLTSFLRLTVAYLGTINDSNLGIFEYDRHIGSISVEASF